MKDPRQSKAAESTNILVCRGIELSEEDRREILRAETALAHVLPRVHRIEWTVTGRPRSVEARASIRAQTGDFEGRGAGRDARTAVQELTKKLLAQTRSEKEAHLGARRDAAARPLAMGF